MIEARCQTCGETFIPDGPNDLEHAERADGAPCGGTGTSNECMSRRPGAGDCLEALAGGWILASDLCPACTRAFIGALEERVGHALVWHPNYVRRAQGQA